MSSELVHPVSGVALKEAQTERLRTANNLADLQDRTLALKNLLGAVAVATTVTVAVSAGANNEAVVTVTCKDANGTAVTAVQCLDLWFAEDAAGTTITTTAYSGTLVANASSGTILTTITAKKRFTVLTNASGVFAGTLTDSAETAGQYCAVKKPLGAGIVVSDALVFG